MNFIKTFLLLSLLYGCNNAEISKDLRDISFHRGYECWRKDLKIDGMPYDLEEIISGIRAAEKGEPCRVSKEEATVLTQKYEEILWNEQIANNLKESESFLQLIAKESIELIPSKLYYKRTKEGNGKPIDPNGTILATYVVKTIQNGLLETFNGSGEFPIEISIPDTIPGFATGVVGMLEGEERTIYIHPELAYGVSGIKLKPNKLVVIEVNLAQ
ncbi:MAG: FKBP-type peptidyl-prolyl cis-trans isomerase [Chlamydiales bacterium]